MTLDSTATGTALVQAQVRPSQLIYKHGTAALIYKHGTAALIVKLACVTYGPLWTF
jgi:hypothetical protein